jgi:hypothetical protein
MIDIATLLWGMRFELPVDTTRYELDIRTSVHFGVTAYVVFASLFGPVLNF